MYDLCTVLVVPGLPVPRLPGPLPALPLPSTVLPVYRSVALLHTHVLLGLCCD